MKHKIYYFFFTLTASNLYILYRQNITMISIETPNVSICKKCQILGGSKTTFIVDQDP